MANKDFYQILGISKNATEKEIKSAYRKLSLKYHPDRQGGKSESEKKQAEKKMAEINEAYSILSDKDKKLKYDTYGSTDDQGFGGFSQGGFGNMDDLFKAMAGDFAGFGNFNTYNNMQAEPGSSIQMKIPLTIEDVYCGCKKKVKFDRQIRCPNCHGEGGTGVKECQYCHGTGTLVQNTRTRFGFQRIVTPCPYCNATGKTVEHRCQTCHGSGFKTSSNSVMVEFPQGIPNGAGIKYAEQGNESKSINGYNGDFYATAEYAFDNNKYRIEGVDVYENIEINYFDALLGTVIETILPNKQKRKIKVDPCTPPRKILSLIGDGLIDIRSNRKGNYYYVLNYKIPSTLTKEEKKALESIKVSLVKKK